MARQTPQLADALDEYLSTRVHLASNTLLNDKSVLLGFVRDIGPIQVGHLTPAHVERYFYGASGIINRMNPASYNKVRQRLDHFFTFCSNRGYNRQHLLANVQRRKTVRRDRLRLTASQMLQLLEVTQDERDRAMLAVATNTALRAGELTALRVGDVNLAAAELHVVISKSAVEDRMPITLELDAELRRWLKHYQYGVSRLLEKDDYLFPARQAPRLIRMVTESNRSDDNLPAGALRPSVRLTHPARIVQVALGRIGLDIEAGEGFHTLRRSAARAYFDSAANAGHDEALRMTSAFLHHSSTQTTEIYLGLQHERVKRDVMMKGKSFLSAMVDTSNVSRLRAAAD